MTIGIAIENDINELALVEIESKKESIPDIIEDFEIDKEARVSRWITYFKGNHHTHQNRKELFLKPYLKIELLVI